MEVIAPTHSREALRTPEVRESAAARSRAATRGRLLSAGRNLFAQRGLHRVTTHDIARMAGVASGTFYLHFTDKRELFREIAHQSVAALQARIASANAGASDRAGAVRARTEALVAFVDENRELARILFSADADAAAVESDVLNALAASIADTRRQQAAEGSVWTALDPAVLSQALVGMLARVVAWWVDDPTRASRETVIDTLTRIQLSGTHPV